MSKILQNKKTKLYVKSFDLKNKKLIYTEDLEKACVFTDEAADLLINESQEDPTSDDDGFTGHHPPKP